MLHHVGLWFSFIILATLIAISAFFSSSETGMMAVNRYRLRYLAKQNHAGALRVLKLLARPDRLLSVILIGNTFANICASSVATILIGDRYGELGILIITVALTFIILIFSEIAPKTLAATYAEKTALLTSLPLSLLLYLLYPLVWIANLFANNLLKLFGVNVHADKVNEALSLEELRSVVHEAGGGKPSEYHRMLLNIFDLEHLAIDYLMIPRSEIYGLDLNDDWDLLLTQLTNSQHTRLPVFHDTIDNLAGVLHMRDALSLLARQELSKETLLANVEPPFFIPEGTNLHSQLLNLRQHKCRVGFVVDEYGEILGLVSLEDILEEIVGEFTTDWADTNQAIHPQADGSYLVDGAIAIRELNRVMNWHLPTLGPKTLSGLIVEYLEDIPNPHTSVRIADYAIEIIQIKDNRIRTAQIRLANTAEEETAS